jgi:hypothetical protein
LSTIAISPVIGIGSISSDLSLKTGCAGSVPAYRGFHPHSLHGNSYAFIKETDGWLYDIQEKQAWTDDPISEFASSGGYYFSSARLALDVFEEMVTRQFTVGGEFYVSLAYKLLVERARGSCGL